MNYIIKKILLRRYKREKIGNHCSRWQVKDNCVGKNKGRISSLAFHSTFFFLSLSLSPSIYRSFYLSNYLSNYLNLYFHLTTTWTHLKEEYQDTYYPNLATLLFIALFSLGNRQYKWAFFCLFYCPWLVFHLH